MGSERRSSSPKDRPPTIREVAKRAGVSPGTVSNALSGLRKVSDDRRRAVLEAVAALGYRSNHTASSLRRGKTGTVGIVVPNLANEFFAGLVRRWEEHAARSEYEIFVVASGDDARQEAHRTESLISRRIDGLLVVAARDDFGSERGFPKSLPPTILIDRTFNHGSFDTVASDNLDAGYRGCAHLIELGHRSITLLVPEAEHAHLRNRIEGYRRALAEAGLAAKERIVFGGNSPESNRSALEQDLRRSHPPTAVFAGTFDATLGAIKAIRALDFRFPEDISLLAFEHSEWLTVFRPYISAVSQSVEDLAGRSWHLLGERISGRHQQADLSRIMVPCTLTIRESTRPPGSS
jgi:LacI family transcriptional regulator